MSRVALFDLDGTLVDWLTGAAHSHGLAVVPADLTEWDWTPRFGFAGMNDHRFRAPMLDAGWWADLLPLDDGMDLFRRVEAAVGRDRIGFLTCANVAGSADGKRRWIARHLPGYEAHMVTASVKSLVAAPSKVLIDDKDENVAEFRERGGRAVTVPRPWNKGRHLCDTLGRFQVGQVLDELIPAIEND